MATASIVLAVVVLVVGAALMWTITRPRSDGPGRTDVLVVLGPSSPERLAVADDVMRRGEADVLLVSAHPSDTLWVLPSACKGGAIYPVYCFDPSPATTQGEARAVAALMKARGWKSARALTYSPHVARARILLDRCVQGEVRVQKVDQPYDLWYQILYQGGGFAKVALRTGC